MSIGLKCYCGHYESDHRDLGECNYCACDEYDSVDEDDEAEEDGLPEDGDEGDVATVIDPDEDSAT